MAPEARKPRPKKAAPAAGELFDLGPAADRDATPRLSPEVEALVESARTGALGGLIAGFDEVGRGPLAGPVVAACVVFPPGFALGGLTDSKVLKASQREALDGPLREGTWWGLGWLWPDDIERLNIHRASLEAMRLAWEDCMKRHPEALAAVKAGLSDGKFCPDIPVPCLSQVKGDLLVPQISAASIIAKVARDAWMDKAALDYPGYGFEAHKGYGTPAHKEAIRRLGPSPIHRLSWLSH